MIDETIISEKKKCFYFDNGFCRYFKSCKYIHPKENCSDTECIRKYCEMRHPKACRHYQTRYGCKFKDKCLFKHNYTNLNCDICENLEGIIEKDKVMFEQVVKNNKEKDSVIENLQAQMETLKNGNINLMQDIQLISEEVEVKDAKIVQLKSDKESLKEQNISLLKEKTHLEEKLEHSADNIKIKDTQIKQFKKEKDSSNVTLTSIKEDIKATDVKILQYANESKSLNVSLASKEQEIKTYQCNIESLKGNLKANNEIISKLEFFAAMCL